MPWSSRIAVVGPGRVGGALALALARAGHALALPARDAAERRAVSRLGLPAGGFGVGEADVVFLTVPDRAIGEVAEALAPGFNRGQLAVHCSGALGLDALAPIRERGAQVGSLHPLCAVASPRSPLAGAWAALEASSPAARRRLARLAREAGLSPFAILPSRRALYHAAAVVASNGLAALAAESAALLGDCGLPPGKALRALAPLMRSALAALEQEGLPRGLTGPVARGDAGTVARHLAALGGRRPRTAALYRALAASLLQAARDLPAGPGADRRAIARLVEGTREQ